MKAVWITWENQRRNRELSAAFGMKLYEFKEVDDIKNPIEKYASGLARTIRAILSERPSLVCCQNPSLVLSAFLVAAGKMAGFKVCVDSHNAGLFPKEGRSVILSGLSRLIQKGADLNLVTNEGLRRHVEENGGRAFILEDKIPGIPTVPPKKLKGEFNILFICSYAEDEPYRLVFDAAGKLDPGIHIYVTGDYRKRNIDPSGLPSNVTLMGYVPEDEYVLMLNSVDATLDLTERENCLVCGAYETLSVGKPQILSDTKALKNYFCKGAVYAPHTVQGIHDSILMLRERYPQLAKEAEELRLELRQEWDSRKAVLMSMLDDLGRKNHGA
ncbi:MAG TPA: hypothetical protein PLA83_06560 [Deltaproteobacteria bacterium]|nr:hypothetical protein [Deltaproteobacteria bacterium]HQI00985.1 hypothetical protein [Deltaproteobacteria bacterium]